MTIFYFKPGSIILSVTFNLHDSCSEKESKNIFCREIKFRVGGGGVVGWCLVENVCLKFLDFTSKYNFYGHKHCPFGLADQHLRQNFDKSRSELRQNIEQSIHMFVGSCMQTSGWSCLAKGLKKKSRMGPRIKCQFDYILHLVKILIKFDNIYINFIKKVIRIKWIVTFQFHPT